MTTRNAHDIRLLIGQGWELPDGPGQIAAAEEAIRHADALGDPRLAFAARMLATSAYHRGGEPAKSFVTFSWCLSAYDTAAHDANAGGTGAAGYEAAGYDAAGFDANDDRMLRWFFKYVVSSLPRFPEIPLERTRAVLDDMERRYRVGGHSPHAVYNLRWLLARHIGDDAAADDWYARWCAAPRDENSDCAGCDPTEKVMHLRDRGRDADAVALGAPVLAGQLTCLEQPHAMLTELLLPYLRTGRLEEARDAHRRAYRAQRGNVANIIDIGAHLVFCAVTGNEARGLEIIQRHLEWLDRAPSPYAEMEFASSAALVLNRLTGAGHGELTVHRRGAADRAAADVAVADLAAELTAQATALAARFDARNGGTYQSRRIAERLAAEPIVAHLPLSATARRRTPAATAPRRSVASAEPDVPATASAEELLDLAERYGRTDRSAAARAVLRVFDERYGDAALAPLLLARRADGRGNDLAEARDVAGAERAWREAVDGYRAAGDELRSHVALGRLGVLLCLTGRGDDGLPLVTRSRDHVLAHGSAERRAGAHSRLGIALVAVGRPAEGLPEFDRAAAAADQADDPYLRADIALRRAHCLAGLDRPAEFQEAARQARDLYRDLGGDGLAVACLLYGTSFGSDEADRALEAFDESVGAASAGRPSVDPLLARARALCAMGRADEAVDDLVEVVALCTELDIAEGAASARFELADAYRRAGRPLDAAEAGEEAVAALTELGAVQSADRCRYLLSAIYRELGEDEDALALLDQVAESLDGYDNLPARGQMREEAGDLLYRLDRDALAAARFLAAAEAFAQAGLPLDELRTRRRHALALRWAGELDAAVAAVAAADKVAGALPEEVARGPQGVWERAMLAYDATKILIGADRPDEALPRIVGVAGQLRTIEAFGEAFLAELLMGELLLRLGRPVEAEPALRGVLSGLPRDSEPLPQAAWLLAQALSMQGRDDEARAVRLEYDLHDDDEDEDELG